MVPEQGARYGIFLMDILAARAFLEMPFDLDRLVQFQFAVYVGVDAVPGVGGSRGCGRVGASEDAVGAVRRDGLAAPRA